MSADQNPTAPGAGTNEPAEDRMSVLERRLAEIQSKSAAASVAPADALPVEMPAQGTEPMPADEPTGAGTAEHASEPVAHAPAESAFTGDTTTAMAPDAGTPEAGAAAETAQHVPDAVTVDGHEMSAPQARAEAHYGHHAEPNTALPAEPADSTDAPALAAGDPTPIVHPVAAEAAALLPEATAPVVEVQAREAAPAAEAPAHSVEESMPALPEAHIHAAAELDSAPEAVASLPTSSETPLPVAAAAPMMADGEGAEAVATDSSAEAAAEAHDAPKTDPSPVDKADVSDPLAPDFTGLDLPAQAAYLVQLLRSPDARSKRKQILDFNRQYETNVGLARTAARQHFADGGAEAEAFAFQQPEGQQELNKAMQEFREMGAKEKRAEDSSRADNLTRKRALLDQLREIVEGAETKDSSAKLKTLQAEWKAAGPVPQTDSQSTWDTYHGLLDIFYSKQGRFLEMKDLDRRRNLEAKEALIKRAEALASVSGINKALDELTKLHEDWKNIGPVPNDQREPIWQRFIAASDVLHQRRKEFVDVRSVQEKGNLEIKKALLDRILPFADFDTDRVTLWRSKTDEIQEIKHEWEAAGQVPRKQADELNKQYWAAYKAFFNRKNDFFKSMDSEKNTNLKAKQSLIEQVEEALTHPDWEAARNIVIQAQKQWKEIGRVPEKIADKLWHRFRTAADSFFDRPKNEVRVREEKASESSVEQVAHLDKLVEQVNALSDENPASLEGFRTLLAEWVASFDPTEDQPGRSSSDRSEEQLLSLLGKYLDKVPGLAYADKGDLLFQTEVARLKARPQAQQQLTRKEMTLRKEINELENDHATLQTNLDFFARSKNAAQLREEYQGRMDEAQKRITVLKKQLKAIRS